jgi:hypothetical protein
MEEMLASLIFAMFMCICMLPQPPSVWTDHGKGEVERSSYVDNRGLT